MSHRNGSADASGEAALVRAGMSVGEARRKGELLEKCQAALASLNPTGPSDRFYVPGRIEVLGKHTDYGGGRSLLMAAERGLCAVATQREDGRVCLVNADDGRRAQFEIGPGLQPEPGHWSNYPMTVARRLARNFGGPLRGADVAFASDLPPAAGMSSSSAMVVLSFLILEAANLLSGREEYRRVITSAEELGEYLGCVENGQSYRTLAGDKGVGTFGGSEDHTAILCCRPGWLSQYSFCPVVPERTVAFPAGHVLVVGVSGVVAEKTGAAQEKYNRVSRLTRELVAAWRERRNGATKRRSDEATKGGDCRLETVGWAPSTTLAQAIRLRGVEDVRQALREGTESFGAEEMLARLEQFHGESERIIPAASDAIERGDLPAFAGLVHESQRLAESALGNQVPETIFLARAARKAGAVAASAFGAGFGGSVWALVSSIGAEAFTDRWSVTYRSAFPQRAGRSTFFITRAGPAAMRLR